MGVILKDEYYQDKTLLQGTFFRKPKPVREASSLKTLL